jgi:hypothetical protein
MEGILAAVIGFVFVCAIFPQLVKNRQQFYGALGLVLVVMVLQGVALLLNIEGLARVFTGLNLIILPAAVLLLFLSAGGITWGGLAGEMKGAFEVIRRGETEKEVIIPIRKQPGAPTPAAGPAGDPPPTPRYEIRNKPPEGPLPIE